ncbi:TetR/AcrR family transcriptional regulator [Variovorax dokdonensis]|uniref:TetR/AcrR family transcriptional regulator n=1 Tax=Variovorax dokdonensis TaxID=344883 RepID=A0ABT7NGL9_9BURK|nr:TetR/AcrR family transcriptional regulator [Variovorax dokdonensis]MDM0047101.1 TetR/AcrR family transcriptional regulator [Variovorax dokdonensis]
MTPKRTRRTAITAPSPIEPASESGTRQLMLETAERLFAQDGLDSVPLHRIVQDSGQRNRSALRYHFGSRPEVVAHVINMRMPVVNARRHVALDEVEAQPSGFGVRDVMLASAQALAQVMDQEHWGRDYVRIISQANFNPAACRYDLIPNESTSSLRRVRSLITALLPGVPGPILDERLLWAEDTVVMTMGRLARIGAAAAGTNVLHNLADHCTGALQAEVSPAARGRRETPAFAVTRHLAARPHEAQRITRP